MQGIAIFVTYQSFKNYTMKKITQHFNKKQKLVFTLLLSGLCFASNAQCPENITVENTSGECGAFVTYAIPGGSGEGQSENGITNGDASDGLTGWALNNGGSGWTTTEDRFVTSYITCSKNQLIDLSDMGLTDEYMDTAPAITVSDDYIGMGPNFSDTYFLTVQLRGATGNVIATYTTGNITTTAAWQTATNTFTGYGPGVRSVYFSHGGDDAEFWAGQYGAAMTNAEVTVAVPTSTTVQTAGFESGELFPMGTTTNTFEITDEDGETTTCSFDVTVSDVQPPTVSSQPVTIGLNADGVAVLNPEDIDNGSTDGGCDVTFSADITEFTCEDLGENTVVFTVTDNAGLFASESVTVTVVDNLGPAITANPISISLGEGGGAGIIAEDVVTSVIDNCGDATYDINMSSFSCENIGENTVTITATDDDGNISTATVVVTVEDDTAPVVITQNITVSLNESGNAVITVDDVNNGSVDNCEIFSYGLDMATFGCQHIGENTVTLTITDGLGNIGMGTAIVTVEDPENYCNSMAIDDINFNESVKVYPNPSNGIITINSDAITIDNAELYDVSGRLVKSYMINGDTNYSTDISDLNAGLYIVKLYSGKSIAVKQLIKK